METLDPAQQAAAGGAGRIQLVLAGPGSGKTTTLTARFIRLVQEGCDRRRILALTFTKKAADEMKERIMAALDLASAPELSVSTFHAFAFRHLRRNPQRAGLRADFELWDAPQQRQVFNSRRMWWNEEIDILDIIAGAKERLEDVASFAVRAEDDEILHDAVEFFRVYDEALRQAGAIDFADMVPLLVQAMARDRDYAALITGCCDHVLVDEYQDVNPGQVQLIDHFVRAGVKLWVVGDEDQMLYAFRAADVRYILDFTRTNPGASVHVLDRNYRSAVQIVAAARRLIVNNRARRAKDQRAVTSTPGEIVIRGYRTASIEARQVARAVAKLIRQQGHAPRQIAVLYRTGSAGLALQPAMRALHIPYEVRGAGDLWQSVAARLVVGSLYYLRDGASVEALSRMGNSRRAEITRGKLDQARAGARHSFEEACRVVGAIVAAAVPGQAAERNRAEWVSVVEAVAAIAASCRSLQEFEARIAEQSAALRAAPEHAVVLSTIHSAKGLEWDAVFIVGLEEGLLPHAGNDDQEEERRVAYVGITRAKRILGLTYAASRFAQNTTPSRFLFEVAGRAPHHYVWTTPQATSADERLPLLSNREIERLVNGRLRRTPEPPPDRPARNAQNGAPARHGKPWSRNEEDRLRACFNGGETIDSLARTHQRKPGAITARLVKLGLLDAPNELEDLIR